jgi:hypothetical protein
MSGPGSVISTRIMVRVFWSGLVTH